MSYICLVYFFFFFYFVNCTLLLSLIIIKIILIGKKDKWTDSHCFERDGGKPKSNREIREIDCTATCQAIGKQEGRNICLV